MDTSTISISNIRECKLGSYPSNSSIELSKHNYDEFRHILFSGLLYPTQCSFWSKTEQEDSLEK